MTNKHLIHALLGTSLLALGSSAYAAKNPINQDYVQLSSSDWAAVCESGNINSTAGCYGDISSTAFAKINRIGGGILSNNGITGGGSATVWLRQIGNGTACANAEVIKVQNTAGVTTTTNWNCGVISSQGQLQTGYYVTVGGANANGCIGYNCSLTAGYPPAATTTLLTNTALINAGIAYNLFVAYGNSTTFPTFYVMCVSTTTNTSTVTPFQQQPGVNMNALC